MDILHKQKRIHFSNKGGCFSTGQVMILTTVIIGGLFLSASVVAGFLMFYQLRQVGDAVASGMAVFATDAGVEEALLCYYRESPDNKDMSELCKNRGRILSNGAGYTSNLYCVGQDRRANISCLSAQLPGGDDMVYGFRVFATSTAQKAERILETFFSTKAN